MTLKEALVYLNRGPIVVGAWPKESPRPGTLLLAYRVHYLGEKDGIQYLVVRAGVGDTGPAGTHIIAVQSFTIVGERMIVNTASGERLTLDMGIEDWEEAAWARNKELEDSNPDRYREVEDAVLDSARSLTPLREDG